MISTVCWNTLPGRLLTFTTVAVPYLNCLGLAGMRPCFSEKRMGRHRCVPLFGHTAHRRSSPSSTAPPVGQGAQGIGRARQERKVDIDLFGCGHQPAGGNQQEAQEALAKLR